MGNNVPIILLAIGITSLAINQIRMAYQIMKLEDEAQLTQKLLQLLQQKKSQ